MTQFSNMYGAYPLNNQIISFDGHDSHFDNRPLIKMKCKNIKLFVLKAGDSINRPTNNNGPNSRLKSLYNM